MAMTPEQLKATIPRGMLAFPLTDFDANDTFDKTSFAAPSGVAVVLPAGGAVHGGRRRRVLLADAA